MYHVSEFVCLPMHALCFAIHADLSLGLLLGTEAPVMTPNSIDFPFLSFLFLLI